MKIASLIACIVAAFPIAAAADACEKNHLILRECLGVATESALGKPTSVAIDALGNVYIAGESIVFEVTAGGLLERVAGNGTPGFRGDGGRAIDALLDMPYDSYPEIERDSTDWAPLASPLAIGPDGSLFILDSYNVRVRRVDAGGVITTVLGAPADASDASHPVADTSLWWPGGLAIDADGSIVVADAMGVWRAPPGGPLTQLAGSWYLQPGRRNVPWPGVIALEPAGGIIAVTFDCRIVRIPPEGPVRLVAGASPYGTWNPCGNSADGGPAVEAQIAPASVALDAQRRVVVADTYNNCIRSIEADGILRRIAGTCGAPGYSGDGGPAEQALLDSPFGVAVDAAGVIYVADTGNLRVRRIGLDGVITTIAGNGLPLAP